MVMKRYHWLAFTPVVFLFACQPFTPPTVTIIDNHQAITLQTDERVPLALLNQAGLTLNPDDRVLSNGLPILLDQPITNYPISLQIRRAVGLTLNTPNGQQQVQSSAFTVGEVLLELGDWLRAGYEIEPGLNSPVMDGIAITITPPSKLTV